MKSNTRKWAEHGVNSHEWTVSGTLHLNGARYSLEFSARTELARFLNFAAECDGIPALARLSRHRVVSPATPKDRLSDLDFHYDPEHNIGAALLQVADGLNQARSYWFTAASVSGAILAASLPSKVELVYDTWNPGETQFSRDTWITLAELWSVVVEWAFGTTYPPEVVQWQRTNVPASWDWVM